MELPRGTSSEYQLYFFWRNMDSLNFWTCTVGSAMSDNLAFSQLGNDKFTINGSTAKAKGEDHVILNLALNNQGRLAPWLLYNANVGIQSRSHDNS